MRILLALLLTILFITPVLADPPTTGVVTNDALTTDNYNWAYLVRGSRGWDDKVNLTLASQDAVVGIISRDSVNAKSGDATLITGGEVGRLPIISADGTTGYIKIYAAT